MGRKRAEDAEASARIRAHLRAAMAERKIDQAELARRLRCDDGNLSRMLRGERSFSAGLVLRISRELQINPTRLLTEDP